MESKLNFDRPIAKKDRENYEINNDGYYFPLYYYMGTASAVCLGMVLARFSTVGSVGQLSQDLPPRGTRRPLHET